MWIVAGVNTDIKTKGHQKMWNFETPNKKSGGHGAWVGVEDDAVRCGSSVWWTIMWLWISRSMVDFEGYEKFASCKIR
jgi:hypothetical protein